MWDMSLREAGARQAARAEHALALVGLRGNQVLPGGTILVVPRAAGVTNPTLWFNTPAAAPALTPLRMRITSGVHRGTHWQVGS